MQYGNIDFDTYLKNYPDGEGYFGKYGGSFIPKELQEAMSLEAQAEQRKKARIILMEAEHDIYEILGEMEELIGDHEAVARLRTMHLLNESLREGKGTVVIPSAFAEGFNEGVGDLFKG